MKKLLILLGMVFMMQSASASAHANARQCIVSGNTEIHNELDSRLAEIYLNKNAAPTAPDEYKKYGQVKFSGKCGEYQFVVYLSSGNVGTDNIDFYTEGDGKLWLNSSYTLKSASYIGDLESLKAAKFTRISITEGDDDYLNECLFSEQLVLVETKEEMEKYIPLPEMAGANDKFSNSDIIVPGALRQNFILGGKCDGYYFVYYQQAGEASQELLNFYINNNGTAELSSFYAIKPHDKPYGGSIIEYLRYALFPNNSGS